MKTNMVYLRQEYKKFCKVNNLDFRQGKENFNQWVEYRNNKWPKDKYETLGSISSKKKVNSEMIYNIYIQKDSN